MELNKRHAVVGHHYWDRPGGGEVVVAAAALALRDAGLTPVLASPVKFDPSKYLGWFGIDLSGMPTEIGRIRMRAFGLYLRVLTWRPILRAIKKYGAELAFLDSSNYRPLLKEKGRLGFKIAEYIHFPFEAYLRNMIRDPAVEERYGRFPMNVYWSGYMWLIRRYIRPDPFSSAEAVMANSRWTAEIVKSIYGKAPEVLNPPLPPQVEVNRSPRPFSERAKQVVMVGRFSEEKRYHWVISEVMPRLLKEVPGATLKIIGSTGTSTAKAYLSRLRDLVAKLGLGGSVSFVPDASRREINEALDSSRAFLHAMVNEHWGIAVAEAMARGVPVVAHRSGGTWTDILMEGRYGLGYSDAGEAAEALARLLTDEGAWRSYSRPERAMDLTVERFKERLLGLLKGLI